MKSKIGIAFIIIGALLLTCGISLFIYNEKEDNEAGKSAELILSELITVIEERMNAASEGNNPDLPEENNSLHGNNSYSTDYPDENKELPVVEIERQKYIGYISIPCLEGLELPIYAEWSYLLLKNAPCLYSGSVYTEDMVLLGHNYTRHFGKLDRLDSGDTLYFVDMDGYRYNYEVIGVEMLSSSSVEEMTAGEYDLSLFTCDYSGKNRFTVRCNRID